MSVPDSLQGLEIRLQTIAQTLYGTGTKWRDTAHERLTFE